MIMFEDKQTLLLITTLTIYNNQHSRLRDILRHHNPPRNLRQIFNFEFAACPFKLDWAWMSILFIFNMESTSSRSSYRSFSTNQNCLLNFTTFHLNFFFIFRTDSTINGQPVLNLLLSHLPYPPLVNDCNGVQLSRDASPTRYSGTCNCRSTNSYWFDCNVYTKNCWCRISAIFREMLNAGLFIFVLAIVQNW